MKKDDIFEGNNHGNNQNMGNQTVFDMLSMLQGGKNMGSIPLYPQNSDESSQNSGNNEILGGKMPANINELLGKMLANKGNNQGAPATPAHTTTQNQEARKNEASIISDGKNNMPSEVPTSQAPLSNRAMKFAKMMSEHDEMVRKLKEDSKK